LTLDWSFGVVDGFSSLRCVRESRCVLHLGYGCYKQWRIHVLHVYAHGSGGLWLD
jgi:hypothetical protein